MKSRLIRSIVKASISITVLWVSTGLAQSAGPEFPDPGHPHMSRDQQQQLGLQTAAQVYQQMPVLPDNSPETQYIRQIGQSLVATIPPQNSWPYEFHVVAQKEINAFALPGGQMFVNIGTITAAASEAQLAGVMGHEMSHVYMQHSAKQQQKAEWTEGLAGVAGAVLGAKGGMIGSLGQMGLQEGAQLLMLKYSRTDESQADAVGTMILYKAGYNPHELANFFKTLEAQGGTPPQFMSDHPNPGNREAAIQKEVENWPVQNYRGDSPAFAKVRQHANGVHAYSGEEIAQGAKSGQWEALNKRNGAVFQPGSGNNPPPPSQASAGRPGGNQGFSKTAEPVAAAANSPAPAASAHTAALADVEPSSTFVLADLGPMKIARPDNWEVISSREQGASIIIAPREGIAGNGVAYGVLINGARPQQQGLTIDQITEAIVQHFQSGDKNLQVVNKPIAITVAGSQGRSVGLQSTSPFQNARGQSQREVDQLITLPRQDGSVIFLVFVAPAADYSHFKLAFEKMLGSVQF